MAKAHSTLGLPLKAAVKSGQNKWGTDLKTLESK